MVSTYTADSLDGFQAGQTTLRVYPACSYLSASFTWKAGLPSGTVLRIVGADGAGGSFGETVLSAESVTRFSAVICTDLTLCNTLTLQAVAPGGAVQFTVNYTCTDWDTSAEEPAATATATSRPSGSQPVVTSDPFTYKLTTAAPTATSFNWIIDGMSLSTPAPAGFQAPSVPDASSSNGFGW